jgi:hypothetical protein
MKKSILINTTLLLTFSLTQSSLASSNFNVYRCHAFDPTHEEAYTLDHPLTVHEPDSPKDHIGHVTPVKAEQSMEDLVNQMIPESLNSRTVKSRRFSKPADFVPMSPITVIRITTESHPDTDDTTSLDTSLESIKTPKFDREALAQIRALRSLNEFQAADDSTLHPNVDFTE